MMTILPVALVVFLVLTLAVAVGMFYRSRHPALGKRVLIRLTEGTALAGTLSRTRGGWLVVSDPAFVVDAKSEEADGTVIVPWHSVFSIQVL